jgi:hypothetical protein
MYQLGTFGKPKFPRKVVLRFVCDPLKKSSVLDKVALEEAEVEVEEEFGVKQCFPSVKERHNKTKVFLPQP